MVNRVHKRYVRYLPQIVVPFCGIHDNMLLVLQGSKHLKVQLELKIPSACITKWVKSVSCSIRFKRSETVKLCSFVTVFDFLCDNHKNKG